MSENIDRSELKTEVEAIVADTLKASGGDRDRAERRAQHDLKMFARKMEDPSRSPSRPTNPKRHEELKRAYTESRAPVDQPVRDRKKPASPNSGIDFYVYKDGEIGTIKIVVEGSFTPLPEP